MCVPTSNIFFYLANENIIIKKKMNEIILEPKKVSTNSFQTIGLGLVIFNEA